MDRYKFKGLRVDNGEWVYGSLVSIPPTPGHKAETRIIEFTADATLSITGMEYEVHPESVGQWTGDHDKNDVEIYEGSRIRLRMYDGVYEGEPKHVYEEFKVVWEQPKMRFGLMPLFEDEQTGVHLANSWAFSPSNDMEVVGTIHDKKEK